MSLCQAKEVGAQEKGLKRLTWNLSPKGFREADNLICTPNQPFRKRGMVSDFQARIAHTGYRSPVVMVMAFQSVSVPSDSHPLKTGVSMEP